MKKAKKVFGTIVFVFVVFLSSLVIISGRQSFNGWQALVVKSGSMEPTIKTGSLIFIKSVKNYQKDDVITFASDQRADQNITHRIVGVKEVDGEKLFQTKGDFNDVVDQTLVSRDRIIGKYQFSLPLIGYVIDFAQTQLGVIFLIVIPGTIIAYEEIKNIQKEAVKLLNKRREDD